MTTEKILSRTDFFSSWNSNPKNDAIPGYWYFTFLCSISETEKVLSCTKGVICK